MESEEMGSNNMLFYTNKICPYCQRVQILLDDAAIDCNRIEIDFTAKPSLLEKLSPQGKIPILMSNGRDIFESSAILEFLNELCGGKYFSSDMHERAVMRSLCSAVGRIHDDVRVYFTAKTESEFDFAWTRVADRFSNLVEHGGDCAFYGERLSMLGVYLAPLVILLQALSEGPREFFASSSRGAKLSQRLLHTPVVARINDENYRSRLLRFVLSSKSHFSVNSLHLINQLLDDNGAGESKAAEYLRIASS